MMRFRFPPFPLKTGTIGFGLATAGLFGVALFLGIADLGFGRVWNEVLGVGVSLVGIVGVHIVQIAFCSLAWRELLLDSRSGRSASLADLFQLRWIRESIDGLLPVVQVGGELAAARLLARQGVMLPLAGASIIADVTIETLAQLVFTLLGLALIFTLTEPGDTAHWAALGLVVAMVFAFLGVFAQRLGGVRLFEKMLLFIAERMGWNKLEGVSGLDDALTRIYKFRQRLLAAGLFHMIAWSLGAGEVLIAARALGYRIDLGDAYVIESLAQAIRSAAFFVPGGLGIQEGGYVVLAGLFGVPPDAAVSISLTKRIRELALGFPGLALWQAREVRRRRARRIEAESAKAKGEPELHVVGQVAPRPAMKRR
jgi:putative membrane protein